MQVYLGAEGLPKLGGEFLLGYYSNALRSLVGLSGPVQVRAAFFLIVCAPEGVRVSLGCWKTPVTANGSCAGGGRPHWRDRIYPAPHHHHHLWGLARINSARVLGPVARGAPPPPGTLGRHLPSLLCLGEGQNCIRMCVSLSFQIQPSSKSAEQQAGWAGTSSAERLPCERPPCDF